MAKRNIDFPDDFFNELLHRKNSLGIPVRWQILNALRKEWGWDENFMPADGRHARQYGIDYFARPPKYHGQMPSSHPLDENGDPIITGRTGVDPQYAAYLARPENDLNNVDLAQQTAKVRQWYADQTANPSDRVMAVHAFNAMTDELGYARAPVVPAEIRTEAIAKTYGRKMLMDNIWTYGPHPDGTLPPERPTPDGAEALDRLADAGNDPMDEEPF